MNSETKQEAKTGWEITGTMFRDAFVSGANLVTDERQAVDALNVFPVPDGDTGTNMSMTSMAAAREAALMPDGAEIGDVAQTIASALLRGARGNSGVILSLLFRGMAKQLRGSVTADAKKLAAALSAGVESAYQAVMKPTEGTILTVAREASQAAGQAVETEPEIGAVQVFSLALASARAALADTPKLLAVLAQAGVVDAGGQGLVHIFDGMLRVFEGGQIITATVRDDDGEQPRRDAAGEFEGEITFTYCTEFLVIKQHDKQSDAAGLRDYLQTIGDCVVVVDDEKLIKCHVHTDNPGNALQKALESGMLSKIKIENMREQHENKKNVASRAVPSTATAEFPYRTVDPSREYGIVAVAAGEGVRGLFTDLNADNVVSGGQTMNPSTDELLAAVQATPAKNVFLLPNNKNIIMASQQAAKLADRHVIVLPTRAVSQGLTAMLAFDSSCTPEENARAMQEAAAHVGYGLITYAVRDSLYEGRKIKANDVLALSNGKLAFTERDLKHATVKLAKSLLKRDSAFITVIYGGRVGEQTASEIYDAIQEKLPESVEGILVNGGQPVYDFMISVE